MKATIRKASGDVIELDGTPEEIAKVATPAPEVTPAPLTVPTCIPSVFLSTGCASCFGRYSDGMWPERCMGCGRYLPSLYFTPYYTATWQINPTGTTIGSDSTTFSMNSTGPQSN